MRKNRNLASAVAVAALVVLTACSPEVSQPAPSTVTIEPSNERLPVASPPADPRPETAWILTGLDAADAPADEIERPAIAVKIENSTASRPQQNLHRADVVYEQAVEGGISRLIAVYHSDFPDEIGPIRSLRPMDSNIIGSYEGPFVFSGAQRRFITQAANAGQLLLAQDTGASGFFRVSTKPAPHNLHGRMSDFEAQAGNADAPPPQFTFAYPGEFATAQTEGETTTRVEVNMSRAATPRWDWDADQQVWLRSEGSTPHTMTDGSRISATNVVVLFVDIRYTSAQGGSAVPETIVIDQSNGGYVISGDSYIEIEWSKGSRTDPFEMTTLDGEPVELMPGQTWIHLAPQSGGSIVASVNFE